MSVRRKVLVPGSEHPEGPPEALLGALFVEAFVDLTSRYDLGNPLEDKTTLGPMAATRFAQTVRDHTADALAKGATATDTSIKRFVAEAQFFRAWYYWKLMESFGGVPLITKVLNTGDTALFTPRSSQSQTADFILSDLAAAVPNLPVQSDLSTPG